MVYNSILKYEFNLFILFFFKAGAQGVLPNPFAGIHGLTSPLAFGGSPVAGGMPLAGFALPGTNAALAGVAGLRLPGAGCVLLVSNLNQEVSSFP